MTDSRISELPAVTGFLDAQEFAVNDAGISRKITGAQIRSAWGRDFLGRTKLAASAHETAVVTIEPRDILWIQVYITAYGGTPDVTGDIGSLRFNGDTGNNYWTRHLYYDAGAWNDVVTASTSLIRLAPTNSRLSRNVLCTVNNQDNRSKTVNMKNQTGTNDATVAGQVNIAGGEWVNLTDRITSVQLVNAGSNNLITGTGFYIEGANLS